jgi:uncharacterized protein (TIGR02391 family)
MKENEPFSIAKYAPTLGELKMLPLETQSLLLLKRLRKLYRDQKVGPRRFCKANFLNRAAPTSDPESLAVDFPENEKGAVVEHLLRAPWHFIDEHFYITSDAGDGWFDFTQEGIDRTNDEVGTISPNRTVMASLDLLHSDLRSYGHYFYEHKLNEAVAAAFKRVENRLNEIRDASGNASVGKFSGVALPRKLFDANILKFPYPKLASGNPTQRDAYLGELKNLLSSSVGWFRNSFQHEPHHLPEFTEAEALEHLFVASYVLRLLDRAI